jgi:hypothetical protein
MEPVYGSSLNDYEGGKAFPYLMFLKQKKSGKVEGGGCLDGRKHQLTLNKDSTSAPTVALELRLLTSIMDEHEHRGLATIDIPGTFMKADIEKRIHLRFEGPVVELLVEMNAFFINK